MKLSKAIIIGIIAGILFYAIFAPIAYAERGGRFDLGGEFMDALLITVMTPVFIKDHEREKERKAKRHEK